MTNAISLINQNASYETNYCSEPNDHFALLFFAVFLAAILNNDIACRNVLSASYFFKIVSLLFFGKVFYALISSNSCGKHLLFKNIRSSLFCSLYGLLMAPFVDLFMVATHEHIRHLPSPEVFRTSIHRGSQ